MSDGLIREIYDLLAEPLPEDERKEIILRRLNEILKSKEILSYADSDGQFWKTEKNRTR